jgi:hypothetical protein
MLNEINWGCLSQSSPYLPWLVKLLAGAAGNRRNTSGATGFNIGAPCVKSDAESMEHWEGAIRLPKASQRHTCKSLKTMAENHFTSKRARPLEGCAADCNLEPPTKEMKEYLPGRALPAMLHRLGKLLQRQGIQHVVFAEPGAPRLGDSVTKLLHVRSVMGVGVDDNLHPVLFRHA